MNGETPEEQQAESPAQQYLTAKEIGFLAEMYQQTWNHYRHLEVQRTNYLAFFFTAALGTVGVGIPLIITGDGSSLFAKLMTALALVFVFEALGLFVFASLRRSGRVLKHYDEAMRSIRNQWGRSLDKEFARSAGISLEAYARQIMEVAPPPGRRRLGTHRMALLVPLSLIGLGVVIVSGALWLAWTDGQVIPIITASVSLVAYLIVFAVCMHNYREDAELPQPGSVWE